MWYSGFLYESSTYSKPVTHILCIHMWLVHVYIHKCDLIGTLKQLLPTRCMCVHGTCVYSLVPSCCIWYYCFVYFILHVTMYMSCWNYMYVLLCGCKEKKLLYLVQVMGIVCMYCTVCILMIDLHDLPLSQPMTTV